MEGDSDLSKALAISLIVQQHNDRVYLSHLSREDLLSQPAIERGGVICRAGSPYPLGPSSSNNVDGINFAVLSTSNAVKLCLFLTEDDLIEIPMHKSRTISNNVPVWHLFVQGIPDFTLYGYRTDDGALINVDPYCKLVHSSNQWGVPKKNRHVSLGHVAIQDTFDWEGDAPPNTPTEDMIIYEMHVRGFTQHRSSGVDHMGSFLGVVERIDHLVELGINAVELLPIFEFDETACHDRTLLNFWGYSSSHFFSPMTKYSTTGNAVIEFKSMVKMLHRVGIKVILDVVYNHTGGYSLERLAKEAYYILDKKGNHTNYSGCGNTVSCNSITTIDLIIDSMRYWVQEMHVDGFRIDEACILGRATDGSLLELPPLLLAMSHDPVLIKTIIIAEAWDAAGDYKVGQFAADHGWSEWNGKFRDIVRQFIKGTNGFAGNFGQIVSGSPSLYKNTPTTSINYVTCHDGFSLYDLVSYQQKHNENNKEHNRDGINDNVSWNCGAEGDTNNAEINNLRRRQMRNFMVALLVSRGIPMIHMGDEYGHTKRGNNNTWCQDNNLNYFQWDQLDSKEAGLFRFVSKLIEFRKAHKVLHSNHFVSDNDIEWHGKEDSHKPDWSNESRFVAFTLKDVLARHYIYVAFNTSHLSQSVSLPHGKIWLKVLDSYQNTPNDFSEDLPPVGSSFKMHSYSSIILKAAF